MAAVKNTFEFSYHHIVITSLDIAQCRGIQAVRHVSFFNTFRDSGITHITVRGIGHLTVVVCYNHYTLISGYNAGETSFTVGSFQQQSFAGHFDSVRNMEINLSRDYMVIDKIYHNRNCYCCHEDCWNYQA